MEIEYMREFMVLAETCNFSSTATILGISQPALTKHVKQLEASLGVTLLLRSTRKVELSEDGEVFLAYAHQITELYAALRKQLSNKEETCIPTLCIATIHNMVQYNITDLLVNFLNRQKVDLKILEQDTHSSKSMLLRNQCDFAFIQEEELNLVDSQFNRFPFTEDHLTAVIPVSHPLSINSTITFKQLNNIPLLTLSAPSLVNTLCMQHCQNNGFTPDIVMTSPRPQTLLQLAASGKGIAILMKKQIMYTPLPDVVTADITPTVTSRINLIYSKKKLLSGVCSDFLKYYISEHGKYK